MLRELKFIVLIVVFDQDYGLKFLVGGGEHLLSDLGKEREPDNFTDNDGLGLR